MRAGYTCRRCCPVCLLGAWSTFWRRIQSVIPKSDPWVLSASWIFVAMKSATAVWGRTTASMHTASSSWRSGWCSTSSVSLLFKIPVQGLDGVVPGTQMKCSRYSILKELCPKVLQKCSVISHWITRTSFAVFFHCSFFSFIITGITHESIVQEAKKFWSATSSLQGAQVSTSGLFLICHVCWLLTVPDFLSVWGFL